MSRDELRRLALGISRKLDPELIEQVIDEVRRTSARHGFTGHEGVMFSPTGAANVVKMRWDCWKRLHRNLGLTMSGIARMFDTDHSTVRNGIYRLEGRQVRADRP